MAKGMTIAKSALAALTLTGTLSAFAVTASAAPSSSSGSFSMYIIGDKRGFSPDIYTWSLYADSLGIFEGLVHNSDKGVVPGIATSWSTSKNGKVWTFHLRHNAKFSNGDAVTAQDFVFGFQQAFNPNTAVKDGGGMDATAFLPVVNGVEVAAGTKSPSTLGVKAVNNYTFQIMLTRKDPTLIQDLTLPAMGWAVPLDPKVVNSMSATDWTTPSKIVSDGPYMVSSFTPNTSATLVPNPYYFNKVKLKKITLNYTASSTGLVDFENGALDMAIINPSDIKAVDSNPTLKSELHFFPTAAQYTLDVAPSQNNALLNPLVRKALMMSINRDLISKDVLQGTGTPAYDYMTPTWLDPWIKKNAIPYNPTEAKALLAQAGYPGGKGFPTLSINVGVGSTPDLVAEAIQQMWQQNLGITVKYNGMPASQFYSTYNNPITSGVAFRQNASNVVYPQLELPTSVVAFLNTGVGQDWTAPYLPMNIYTQWQKVIANKSMPPKLQQEQAANILIHNLPKSILQWIRLGVKAYNTNNTALMKQFFYMQEEQVFDLPIYTPLQPVLIRSNVHGYKANSFLLTTPPVWFNDITVS